MNLTVARQKSEDKEHMEFNESCKDNISEINENDKVATCVQKFSGSIDRFDALKRELEDRNASITALVQSYYVELQINAFKEMQLEKRKLRAAQTNDLSMLQNRINELRAKLRAQEAITAKRDSQFDNTTALLSRKVNYLRSMWKGEKCAHACFQNWSLHIKQRSRNHKIISNRRSRRHRRILLYAITRWRNSTREQVQIRAKALKCERHENKKAMMQSEYEDRIHQLETDLEIANKDLLLAENKQAQMEENLRKVFLRGVSAMNLEALTLFAEQHRQNNSINGKTQLTQPYARVDYQVELVRRQEASDDTLAEQFLPLKQPAKQQDLTEKLQHLLNSSRAQLENMQKMPVHETAVSNVKEDAPYIEVDVCKRSVAKITPAAVSSNTEMHAPFHNAIHAIEMRNENGESRRLADEGSAQSCRNKSAWK